MIARNSAPTTAPTTRRMRPSVTPRDLHFQHQAAPSNAWLGGDVVGTAILNALSLTFPVGERLFMDAVRQYRAQLSGRLLDEAQAFIAQEAVHSREHLARNGGLDRARYPVDAIEAEIRERMTRVRERGPMAMLSVTIALEHFTAILADLLLSDDSLLEGAPPEVARLWRWHAMEETEHKAVSFDVFQEVSKTWKPSQRYGLRAISMLVVTRRFIRNITLYATRLLTADGMGKWEARARVLWYLFGTPGLLRKCGLAYLDWFRPGFHPWDHDSRVQLDALRADYQLGLPAPAAA